MGEQVRAMDHVQPMRKGESFTETVFPLPT